jgi:hypothetical protein
MSQCRGMDPNKLYALPSYACKLLRKVVDSARIIFQVVPRSFASSAAQLCLKCRMRSGRLALD